MPGGFQARGTNRAAPFSLRLHRGDGMALVAMDWRGTPPRDFVGFAIEYKEPGGDRFYAVKNRLTFAAADGQARPDALSTRLSPIQKFRWVHFPRNAELPGEFTYRVTPVFMDPAGQLQHGEAQEAAIPLRRETHPGVLNVTYTRGFVSSQAFVDRYQAHGDVATLLPPSASHGLAFVPSHPKADEALAWMGFEARSAILEVLDEAIADPAAQVRVVAYDLSEPDILARLERLGKRLKAIIDDSAEHGEPHSAESEAARRLEKSAGKANVKRQHMRGLQHNKTIVVDGPKGKRVVCGSTNFSWRGLFVQSNHALVLKGARAAKPFLDAFDAYWAQTPEGFGASPPASWTDLGLRGVKAQVAFSPHAKSNALLEEVAEDIGSATSSLFYSMAFLYQTRGPVRAAIEKATADPKVFVYGVSDRKVGGIDLQKPDGNVAPVYPAALSKNVPAPFSAEPSGGGGIRMHHKFAAIDFDKPSARVYLGSYNFSNPADRDNGENLLLIRDRRVATSFVIEALRIFDHYHFRVAQQEAATAKRVLELARPPADGEEPWWAEHYTDPRKVRDRKLFA